MLIMNNIEKIGMEKIINFLIIIVVVMNFVVSIMIWLWFLFTKLYEPEPFLKINT